MINKSFITHKRAPFFELARPYIGETGRVLDIGPGEGNFSAHFDRTDFYLLEGNATSYEKLVKEHPNTVYGRLPKLPFPDQYFDVIHCSHVVEHLQPQEFYDTLCEMDRCLAIDGTLIISAPLLWEGFYDDLSHVKPYGPEILQKYLCRGDGKSLTRDSISSSFKMIRTEYRYRHIDAFENYYAKGQNLAVRLWRLMQRVSHKYGIRKVEKTGYTTILKKGKQ